MGLNNTLYDIYNNSFLEWQYGMDRSMFLALSNDIINGTIQGSGGFGIGNFFTEYSDYLVKWQYFFINIRYLFNHVMVQSITIGKKNYSGYTAYTINDTGYVPSQQLFTYTPSRNFNNFLDFKPYTKITLQVPYFEKIELDPQAIYGHTVDGYINVDRFTGHATLYVMLDGDTGILLETREAQLSIELPLGSSNENEQSRNRILNAIRLGGSALALASGNPVGIASGIALGTNALVTGLSNEVDRMTGYKGSQGFRDQIATDNSIRVIIERPQNVTVPDYSLVGKPYNENRTLSTLQGTGFTKVGNIEIDPSLNMFRRDITTNEIDLIVSKLKEGVYL